MFGGWHSTGVGGAGPLNQEAEGVRVGGDATRLEFMIKRIGELWCKKVHARPMWPMHGRYLCSRCLREYPVAWGAPATRAESHSTESMVFVAKPDLKVIT